jgi:hypothetical protein
MAELLSILQTVAELAFQDERQDRTKAMTAATSFATSAPLARVPSHAITIRSTSAASAEVELSPVAVSSVSS